MTLTLAMIARDEENCIARILACAAPYVDEIVVADTGSTDHTREIAKAFGAKVFEFDDPGAFDLDVGDDTDPLGPFTGQRYLSDFSAARNFAFSQATKDYIMWLDADDLIIHPENLAETLRLMDVNKSDLCMIPYQIDFYDDGGIRQQYYRERIIRRGSEGLKWICPVHEVIQYQPTHRRLHTDHVIIQHQRVNIPRPPSAVQFRNLKILTKRYSAGVRDSRELFYLGAEWAAMDPDKAIRYYREYLSSGYFPEEQAHARLVMGSLLEAKGDDPAAYEAFSAAHFDTPNNPDSLFALARLAMKQKDYRKVVELVEKGWACDTSKLVMPGDPVARATEPRALYDEAKSKMGGRGPLRCFNELSESLCASLNELGVRKSIVLGAHSCPTQKFPADVVIFNTEQLTSPWFTPEYVDLLKRHEVWDFSPLGATTLRGKYGIDAKLCQIGYHPCMSKIELKPDPDIDVLFYGSINEGRKKILDDLAQVCRVHIATDVYGKELDELISRSKIVLNMHFYPNAAWEAVRCSYLLANGVCVVSETPLVESLRDAVAWASYNNLVLTCQHLLMDGGWREQGAMGKRVFSKMLQVNYLRKVLT